ncbi:hypothetical protein MMC31_001024 [Peltigera leucophlebia]|nr:hypothetical protein [Peltigera leucophlebia]
MIVNGLVISTVAILLGIFTRPPQGGGGLVNNLKVMSCLLSSPLHLPPPPPAKAKFFDIDDAIFEIHKLYVHHHAMICNLTQGPMPQYHVKPHPAAGSSNPTTNPKFAIPTLSLPLLSTLLVMIGEAFANIAMAFIVFCLPWLACGKLPLPNKIQQATYNSLAAATLSEEQWDEIEPHNRLFCELQVAISEHGKGLAEAEMVMIKEREGNEEAFEGEFEMEQSFKGLEKERDDALEERARGRENFERLEKEKEVEVERLKKEKEKLVGAWDVKERHWEERRLKEEKNYRENNESLRMGRERESWKEQVERLKTEKKEMKEKMEMEIFLILMEKKQELEILAKEKEGWEKNQEEEMKKLEQKGVEREAMIKRLEVERSGEKYAWEIKNNRAQERIFKLEEENAKLRNAVAPSEKVEEEQKAAKAIPEGEREVEKKRWEGQIAEAKKLTSKLEVDLINGRKLIEDLQTDKRMDRQLLIELRAQLVRQTHITPPTHLSPLRFGGTPYAFLGAPDSLTPPAPLINPSPSPKVTPSPQPTSSFPPTIVRRQPTDSESRPIVRLPPQIPLRQETSSRLPKSIAPPPNAPTGPKGWM